MDGQQGMESTEAPRDARGDSYLFLPSESVCDTMANHAEVQKAVDAAVEKGQYPDRKAAIAGMMKQLVQYQKGALKGKINGEPVSDVEKVRAEVWQALLKQAGGDEDKAVQLYADELKKLSGQQ
jgi:hypothetical protein